MSDEVLPLVSLFPDDSDKFPDAIGDGLDGDAAEDICKDVAIPFRSRTFFVGK